MAISLNFNPSPVRVMMPTMMPAQAQVAAMPTACTAPEASASTSLRGQSALSGRRKESSTATTMA